jgi:hypothetical protein
VLIVVTESWLGVGEAERDEETVSIIEQSLSVPKGIWVWLKTETRLMYNVALFVVMTG